jgi:hypothetical protein
MLQPRDVIMNGPFKAQIPVSYNEEVQLTNDVTPTGCLKRTTLTEMCLYILRAG